MERNLQTQHSLETDEAPLAEQQPYSANQAASICSSQNGTEQQRGSGQTRQNSSVHNGASENNSDSNLSEDCVPTNITYQRLHNQLQPYNRNSNMGCVQYRREQMCVSRNEDPRPVDSAGRQKVAQNSRPAATQKRNIRYRDIDEVPQSLDPPNNPLKRESERLKTLRNWPKNNIVSREELAGDGFIYMNKDDYAQCVFCHGILSGWSHGDKVIIEHRRHYPHCKYVKGEQVGNVPLNSNNFIAYSGLPEQHGQRGSEFACNIPNVAMAQPADISTGVMYQKPKYPEYAVEATRLQTYTSWPAQMKQTPQQLSKAGLYYMGQGDRAKCFYCGGVLYDWDPEDDPWVEHAKWFSECPYVKLMKGDNFLQQVHEQQVGGETQQTAAHGNLLNGDSMLHAISDIETSADVTQHVHTNGPVAMETEQTADCKTSSNSHKPAHSDQIQSGEATESETSMGKDVDSILQENRDLKEERLCKICMEEEVRVTFVPCGHLVCCAGCAAALIQCPICRQNISGIVKTYWT